MDSERIKLTGLWESTTKDGKKYLSGTLAPGVKVLVFENSFRKDDSNQPTHELFVAKATKPEATDKPVA